MNAIPHVTALYLLALFAAICCLAYLAARFIRTGEGDDKPLPPQSIRGGGVFMDRSGR